MSPDAFARVVDRLLASPHYGERWGRHWLDVARYADTKDGVLMFGDDRVRPYAYTYRDYVIRAFNEDLGFDRFIHEQLAADMVAPKDQRWRLAAMGFLTLGRMFDNNIHDQIDDRIDTVTRGFLGLTVACARCHDHKYDAIPTADYYSLYGVFASSEAPLELPLIDRPDPAPGSDDVRETGGRQAARAPAVSRQPVQASFRSGAAADARLPGQGRHHAAGPARDGDLLPFAGARRPAAADRRAVAALPQAASPAERSGLRPLARPDGAAGFRLRGGCERRRRTLAGPAAGNRARPVEPADRRAPDPRSSPVQGRRCPGLRRADPAGSTRKLERPSRIRRVQSRQHPARRQIQAILADHDSPAYFPKSQTYYYMSRAEKDGFGGKLTELDRMAVKAGERSARGRWCCCDAEELCDPRIFVRGNPSQPGERVPRQFLRVLAGPESPAVHPRQRAARPGAGDHVARESAHQPGHCQPGLDAPLRRADGLDAQRLRHAQHASLAPLAARLPGGATSARGLVAQGAASPDHALQHLPAASFDRPACRQVDPENRLLWRFPRRRLDLEAMRDTLLFVSGRLDPRMGGRPVDVAGDPKNGRRTVYGMVDRQSLPAVFRAFDFASPDQSAERGRRTTVPQQALFSMNAPFVIEQAKALAAAPEVAAAATTEARSPRSIARSWPGLRSGRDPGGLAVSALPGASPRADRPFAVLACRTARPGPAHDE